MARRLLVLTAAALFVITAACGTDDGATATKKDTSGTTADESTTTTKEPPTTHDKDEETESESETEGEAETETETETESETGDGSDPEFCQIADELDNLFDGLEEDDYQGLVDAIEAADSVFEDYLDRLPDDLKDEGTILIDAVKDLGSKMEDLVGDPDAEEKAAAAYQSINTPEVQAAGEATDAYEKETCGEA